jgi:hypothetical protein
MQRINQSIFLALMLTFAGPLVAQESISLGVVLNGSGWSGDNGTGNTSFESDEGGQFGLNASWKKDKLYIGLSLQGGDYQFDGTGPTQFASSGLLPTQGVKVTHSDFDLLAGYYFWDQVSLFVDLKASSATWQNNDYKHSFSGLGFGVAGYNPINADWTFFGSWGFVGGDAKEGSRKIGDAGSSALILGANYMLNKDDFINMGFKFRGFTFDYDDGNEQEYNLDGVFFGYHHAFEL